jgi:hypothetical protein
MCQIQFTIVSNLLFCLPSHVLSSCFQNKISCAYFYYPRVCSMHVQCSSKQQYVGPVHSELQYWERSAGWVGGWCESDGREGYEYERWRNTGALGQTVEQTNTELSIWIVQTGINEKLHASIAHCSNIVETLAVFRRLSVCCIDGYLLVLLWYWNKTGINRI